MSSRIDRGGVTVAYDRVVSLPLYSPAPTFDLARLPAAEVEALYVHVPFCFHKCHYCDFYSITRQTPERMERFVDLILREADLWLDRSPAIAKLRTIFFGGGTPSLLHSEAMERLLRSLADRFDLRSIDEWTVEVNPATADETYLRMMRRAGVDRVSLGAQSFDPAELKTLERHHDPDDVPRAVAMARSAGFERVSLDLIYAIPGQTIESWRRSLDAAISLGTEHLSCYGLTYEPNTAIAVRKRLGRLVAAEDETELAMLRDARSRLAAAGLQAYEISNYAKPGRECRHNLVYWNGGNYLGLGPSAASHVAGTRFRNRPHLGEWESAIERGVPPFADVETLGPASRLIELGMLQLRLVGGVDLDELTERYGVDARSGCAARLRQLLAIGLVDVDGPRVRLSDSGLAVADAVALELFGDFDG